MTVKTSKATPSRDQDLRNAGLKVTSPRRRILETFERSRERHLSAEDIYRLLVEAGPDIGLATVYRVLAQFESAELLTRHHFEGGLAVFELKEGPHHDHMVCLECGRVEEFADAGIEARQIAAARKLRFTVSDHSLVLYGRCAACTSRQAQTRAVRDAPAKSSPTRSRHSTQ